MPAIARCRFRFRFRPSSGAAPVLLRVSPIFWLGQMPIVAFVATAIRGALRTDATTARPPET
jgi:hypothetical protein